MAKDKRLLIARSIIVHAQRLVSEGKVSTERFPTASEIPVFMEFTVPPKLLQAGAAQPQHQQQQQQPQQSKAAQAAKAQGVAFAVTDKTFLLPHSVVARTGRGSVLIVPHDVAVDCAKVNKRYELFDAVVSLESLTKDEKLGPKKAAVAAATFSRFIFDERCMEPAAKLPRCLRLIAMSAPADNGGNSINGHVSVQVLKSLKDEDRSNLVFVLKQAGQGTTVERLDQRVAAAAAAPAAQAEQAVVATGALRVRVGHCGMTAGSVTENGKEMMKQLRADFPHIARAIQVINLTTAVTRPIQWMELQFQR